MKKGFLIASILLFSLKILIAQTYIYGENHLPIVTQNNVTINNPWCGGINSTQLQKADLNNDGFPDLVIYDRNTLTLKTFINQSSAPNSMEYVYDPKYAKNFPFIRYYVILKDYNCDGIEDMFTRGEFGVTIHKGSYINNELTFSFYKTLWYQGNVAPENAYVQLHDIPSIVDIDRDGDLDFLAFDVQGYKISFYKNMRVENNLPCDSINIIFQTPCWGKVTQNFYRTHNLNSICKGTSGTLNKNQTRHSGNCIVHVDIDGDGDYDLLGGNTSFTDAQLLINGGTLNNAIVTSQDSLFDADGHQVEINNWTAPHWMDIDNDGINDLLFTPHADNISCADYNAIAFYKNVGSNITPSLEWKNDSLLVESMIDVGANSYPALFDYNKDGKLDIFVGNEGYFNTSTKLIESKLAYFRNTSTLGNISFELVTRDFMNLSQKNYLGIYPAFGDLDGDGIDDLILGNDSGYVAFYNNTALSNTAQPIFTLNTDSLPGIDVGFNSFPLIYDYNKDGLSDLVIGNDIGFIALYIDSGSVGNKDLKLVNSSLGNIKAGSQYTTLGYAAPFIGFIDTNYNEALIIGTADGTLEIYDSIDQNYALIPRADSLYSYIQLGFRAVPKVGDLDGDGIQDMVVGNQNGGLQLFRLDRDKASISISTNNFSKPTIRFNAYPNPTQDLLFIELQGHIKGTTILELIDITGRTLLQTEITDSRSSQLNTALYQPGIYFIRLKNENNIGIKKITKQ